MIIAALREEVAHEKRVALTPDAAAKLIKAGYSVRILSNAGDQAGFPDELYSQQNVQIASTPQEALDNADVLLCIQPPQPDAIQSLKPGCVLIGLLEPHNNPKRLLQYAKAQISAWSMELLPRITRAQSMDALSSQANIAGYCAVIVAAHELPRILPLMMTAAGTIAPAKTLIIGAGVAGLQAVATAKRLGAAVRATDVRSAAAEQVESLGAQFLAVPLDPNHDAEDHPSGYARETSDEYRKKQAELVHNAVIDSDIVVTTALVPGKPAPTLVHEDAVNAMRPGSVIVDLAAPQGGNCAVSQPGKTIVHNNVTVLAPLNAPSLAPHDSAQTYSQNLANLVLAFTPEPDGQLRPNPDDDIIQAVQLTHQGNLVHPDFTSNPTQKS